MASAAHPLVMVEVVPLSSADLSNGAGRARHCGVGASPSPPAPYVSAPLAKMQLLNMSRQGSFTRGWLDGDAAGAKRDSSTPAKDTSRRRGLWLSSDGRAKCGRCRGRTQSAAKAKRNIAVLQAVRSDDDRRIISGDLAFRGKGPDAKSNVEESSQSTSTTIPVTNLRSDDPLDDKGVPCLLRGYILESAGDILVGGSCSCHETHLRCEMTSGTVVHICHPSDLYNVARSTMQRGLPRQCDLLHQLLGKPNATSECRLQSEKPALYSKLACYNEETVGSLSLRMSTMLANTVWIGTTPRALSARKARQMESEAMAEELDAFWETSETAESENKTGHMADTPKGQSNPVPLLLREGALLVYNSHPNSGKTALVAAIAKDVLNCDAVHVISTPASFAKYGTAADAALETMLHGLSLRCAVRGGAGASAGAQGRKVAQACIILDHLETFLPLSGQPGGNPYFPVLNAMAAYLNRLSHSLKARNEFPFPTNNPLNNVCETGGDSPGFALPLGICLVGVTTCTEGKSKASVFQSALDALGGGRFCVPLPSAATRLSALQHAFGVCGIRLAEDAKKALPELAASVTWASGGAFLEIARRLRSDMKTSGASLASELDLKRAMSARGEQSAPDAGCSADFPALSTTRGSKDVAAFASVGGNSEAKLALEDALALDPRKRQLLAKFGLQTPCGVLLYGPPGCGKTLLARAVSQTLSSQNGPGLGGAGGAFVALKASDIVRPEVGNSEKLIVSAFETAQLNAPSVIFIDEFQALFGDREGGSFVLGQLASTLLQCLDDITRWSGPEPSVPDGPEKARKNGRVVVLGATNTPWMIDKAFLRPGRFDRAVHVGLPGVDESEEILRVHVSQMKLAPQVSVDEICKAMATLCLGFSGADLAALCRAAAVRCLSSGDGATGITKQHFQEAYMHDVVRSSNDALVRRLSAWKM